VKGLRRGSHACQSVSLGAISRKPSGTSEVPLLTSRALQQSRDIIWFSHLEGHGCSRKLRASNGLIEQEEGVFSFSVFWMLVSR